MVDSKSVTNRGWLFPIASHFAAVVRPAGFRPAISLCLHRRSAADLRNDLSRLSLRRAPRHHAAEPHLPLQSSGGLRPRADTWVRPYLDLWDFLWCLDKLT